MTLSTKFDSIFRAHAGRVPVAYLRALSKRESNQNPLSADGAAWGLLQVVPDVRTGYNERYGTSYSAQNLLDPDVNTRIAADLLNRIVVAFAKHPSANMKTNWGNPEFAKLVTAGWNSGYSEAKGVGYVAGYLEARGIPVTHDNVFAYAAQAGATPHLQSAAKQSWQRSVAELFYAQPDAPSGLGSILSLALVGFVAWGAYRLLQEV